MAKKPKKGAAPPEDGEAAEPATPAAGGRKRLVLIAAAAAVIAGGAGAYWFLKPNAAGGSVPEAQASAGKPAAFVELREMVINLSPEPNQDRARFLKLKISLEVTEPKSVPGIQPLLPRVEDTMQVFMRELRASDLEGSAGVYRLREELLRRVNVALYPAKIEAVLFKDIVVQ
jgi:flagellar FliL protein